MNTKRDPKKNETPLPEAAPMFTKSRQSHGAAPRKQPKILVVDDELDILRSTQMLLQRLGYDCIVLPAPEHLLEVIQAEKPDLVLQDLFMPDLDMVRVMGQLRASPTTKDLPLVLFSASDELSDQAADLDAAGFLHKPFSEQQLVEVLERVLGPILRATNEASTTGPSLGLDRTGLKQYFHEFRNSLTALNNYAQFLLNSAKIRDPEREAAEEINRLLLDLERRTTSLRGQLLGDE